MEYNRFNYEENLKEEYYRLQHSIHNVEHMRSMCIAGEEDSQYISEYSLLDAQLHAMKTYAYLLQERARLEGIAL